MNIYKKKDLKKFFESIPQEEVERQTQLQIENNARVYKEFNEALNKGKCFLCGEDMSSLNTLKQCLHWFTYPIGIRKKHFNKYFKKPLSFYRLDSYLRWLANYEKPLVNINDLKEDASKSSFIETTIRYKNIEWAFSIGKTDKEGHPNKKYGSEPHYHIQMKIDNKLFIKFSDYHIKFTDDDLFYMELFEQAGDKIKHVHTYGQGIGIIENEDNLKLLEKKMITSDDETNAPFRRQTLIISTMGNPINGEIFGKAIKESKMTKEPIGRIIKRLLSETKSEAKVSTIITPGDNVPEMVKRIRKK